MTLPLWTSMYDKSGTHRLTQLYTSSLNVMQVLIFIQSSSLVQSWWGYPKLFSHNHNKSEIIDITKTGFLKVRCSTLNIKISNWHTVAPIKLGMLLSTIQPFQTKLCSGGNIYANCNITPNAWIEEQAFIIYITQDKLGILAYMCMDFAL